MNKARDLSFDAVTAKLTLYGSKQEQEVMKMQSDMEKRWLPLMTSTPSCPRTSLVSPVQRSLCSSTL